MSTVVRFPGTAMRRAFQAQRSPAVRNLIEDEIERLISLLDVIDGDEDREDDGTAEPSLGWTMTMAHGPAGDLEIGEVAP